MQMIEKTIDSTIIGKDTYDLIFEIIDKVIIGHKTIEVQKGKYLDKDCALFIVALLLIEEVNKFYSMCEDKDDKATLEKAIYRLYKRVNGGANNGRKRSERRSNKKYSKN